jgi:hypothetical protein
LLLASAGPALAADFGGDFDPSKKGFEAQAGQEGIGPKGSWRSKTPGSIRTC